MILVEDVANKLKKHEKKNRYWQSQGIEVVRHPLPIADYVLMNDKIQDVVDRKEKRSVAIKKMDFIGTYDVAVDTKFGIAEVVSNICGKSHDRFRDECILAQNNGVKLYILVEDDGGWVDKKHTIWNKPVGSVNDLFSWKNPRAFIWRGGRQLYPTATKGKTLAKACITMQNKYGCEFIFCSSNDAGAKIVELLGGDVNGTANDIL